MDQNVVNDWYENAIAAGVMNKSSALRTKRNGRAKLACVIII